MTMESHFQRVKGSISAKKIFFDSLIVTGFPLHLSWILLYKILYEYKILWFGNRNWDYTCWFFFLCAASFEVLSKADTILCVLRNTLSRGLVIIFVVLDHLFQLGCDCIAERFNLSVLNDFAIGLLIEDIACYSVDLLQSRIPILIQGSNVLLLLR